MHDALCQSGTWGHLGNIGGMGGIGLILALIFWVGLIAGLTVLVVWAVRRARVGAVTVPSPSGQPNTKENLQARYARGEITREQYELGKHNIG